MSATTALAEWKRARESLGAAGSCHRDGYYADAVSRAYYAVLHGAKAALEFADVPAPDTHDGVSNRFGLHISRPGLVERSWGREIGRLLSLRILADYEVNTQFSDADARMATDRAEAFLNRIRALLATSIPGDQLQ